MGSCQRLVLSIQGAAAGESAMGAHQPPFLHLILEVLTIVEMLPPSDVPAFLATCRDARTAVHNATKSVKLPSFKDLTRFRWNDWPHLRSLDLRNSQLDSNSIFILLRQPWSNLETLRLGGNDIGCTEIKQLVEGEWPAITTLDLSDTLIDAPAVGALNGNSWPKLRHLNLSKAPWNELPCNRQSRSQREKLYLAARDTDLMKLPLHQQSLSNLADSLLSLDLSGTSAQVSSLIQHFWAHLRTLTLDNGRSFAVTISSSIGVSNHMPQLRMLSAQSNSVKPCGMSQLALAGCTGLEELNLCGTFLLPAVTLELGRFCKLRYLNLGHVALRPNRCMELSEQTTWSRLETLILRSNRLLAYHIAKLISGNWPQLAHLDLGGNELTSQACLHLKSAKWPLQCLLLDRNRIDDAGVSHLVKAVWPGMRLLNLSGNKLCSQAIRELVKADWPLLEELWLENNQLDGPMASRCCHDRWPCLKMLHLKGNWGRELPL